MGLGKVWVLTEGMSGRRRWPQVAEMKRRKARAGYRTGGCGWRGVGEAAAREEKEEAVLNRAGRMTLFWDHAEGSLALSVPHWMEGREDVIISIRSIGIMTCSLDSEWAKK